MADVKEKDPGEVTLKRVMLSFPHLFKPQDGRIDKDTGKKGEPKFNCSLLIPKTDKAQLDEIKAAVKRVKVKKYGSEDKAPKYKPEKLAYRDGDQEEWEGYEGTIYVSASSPQNRKPKLIDRDKSELREDAGKIYGGVIVNAVVRFWIQDNEHGKRVNCSIEAVQFVKHGTAFGAKPVDVDEAFEDLSDDDEDMDEADRFTGAVDPREEDDDDLLG